MEKYKIGDRIIFWMDSERSFKGSEIIESIETYKEDSGKRVKLYTTQNSIIHEEQVVKIIINH